MKWYMALNEAGTRGDIALHTKIAILSAAKHTKLCPKMLYVGERNNFTKWLERHGVEVLDQQLPYMATIDELVAQGRYSKATVGHWLRTNTCIAETEDDYILYTDVDVMFMRTVAIADIKPQVFAATPEFDRDSWNYFNAGVMIQNIIALRARYEHFEAYLKSEIARKTYSFHDQIAYNIHYKGLWQRLPLTLNWKPYWGLNPEAEIVHFHGPKIGAIEAIVSDQWDWTSNHGSQIGSMLCGFLDSYRTYIAGIPDGAPGLADHELERLTLISRRLNRYVPPEGRKIELDFMKFKMFPE